MALIGYARVSTDEQAAQLDALRAAGCATILEDRASGGGRARPKLARALERVGEGDTLLVMRIDASPERSRTFLRSSKACGRGARTSDRSPIRSTRRAPRECS